MKTSLSGMISCTTGMHMQVTKIDITALPCAGSAALEESLYEHLNAMALKLNTVIELKRNLEPAFVHCFANGHKFSRVNNKDNS